MVYILTPWYVHNIDYYADINTNEVDICIVLEGYLKYIVWSQKQAIEYKWQGGGD